MAATDWSATMNRLRKLANYGQSYWAILRTSFLVGPDGKVAHVWKDVKPEDHAVDVLGVLRQARAGS